jgi:segregation and condensation protein A
MLLFKNDKGFLDYFPNFISRNILKPLMFFNNMKKEEKPSFLKSFENQQRTKTIKQEQVQDILFGRDLGWQELIYDLINTEQLDPWDIDLKILVNKYLEKIRKIEEADFFVCSKVLLAASLLLRIKSEILLSKYVQSIDEILFGKKEKVERKQERIELEDEIPELIPKSPMPRYKKVTLQELVSSLNKAINTENRRIKKVILKKNSIRESSIFLPKKKISIKDKIKNLYSKVVSYFEKNKTKQKISLTALSSEEKQEKIASFTSLLHLENQKKVWLEQEAHFEEIYVWLKDVYFQNNPDPFEDLKQTLIEETKKLDKEKKERLEKIKKNFKTPIGE